jgi:predicted kinase
MISVRLAHGKVSALDCTHTSLGERLGAIQLASEHQARVIALLSAVSPDVVHERNMKRPHALQIPASVVSEALSAVREVTKESLLDEGFDEVYTFDENCDDIVISFSD